MDKDAIIVIDSGIKEDNTLTEISMQRVSKAAQIYKLNRADKVIMSGGEKGPRSGAPATKTEAQGMKEYGVGLGIPAGSILLEERSKDIIGNAYFSKILYLEPSHWKNIIVISSVHHLPRAEYVFKKILGPDYAVEFIPADDMFSPSEDERLRIQEEKKLALAKEWLGPIKDGDTPAVQDFINNWHPYYKENKKMSSAQLHDRLKEY